MIACDCAAIAPAPLVDWTAPLRPVQTCQRDTGKRYSRVGGYAGDRTRIRAVHTNGGGY